VRDQEWDSTTTKLNPLNLRKLVLGLLGLDSVNGESTLCVVDKTEVLASLVDSDNVHETSREHHVGADFAVDLDKALHHDGLGLAVVEGILQAVANEDDEGKAVTELVGTGAAQSDVSITTMISRESRKIT
jgi:hypothetical protein